MQIESRQNHTLTTAQVMETAVLQEQSIPQESQKILHIAVANTTGAKVGQTMVLPKETAVQQEQSIPQESKKVLHTTAATTIAVKYPNTEAKVGQNAQDFQKLLNTQALPKDTAALPKDTPIKKVQNVKKQRRKLPRIKGKRLKKMSLKNRRRRRRRNER